MQVIPDKNSIVSSHFIYLCSILLISATWTVTEYREEWIDWWHGLSGLILLSSGCLAIGYLVKRFWPEDSITKLPPLSWFSLIIFSLITATLCLELHANLSQTLATATGCIAYTFLLHAIAGQFSLIFWIPFLFLEIAQFVSYYKLGVRITSGIIAEMIHASHAEICNFATSSNLTGLALALLTAIALSMWQYRILKNSSRKLITRKGCILLACFYILLAFIPQKQRLSPRHLNNLHILPYPAQETLQILKAVSEEAHQDIQLLTRIQNIPSPAAQPSRSEVIPADANIVCILHIGESVRADRLGFNGYHRNTTPWLSSRKNLISYPRCISLHHQTTTAIVGILTDGARKEASKESFSPIDPNIGNIADLFSKHGFHTALLTGHHGIHQNNNVARYTFGDALLSLNRNTNCIKEAEGSPMQQAQQVIDLCREHSDRNMFIILNNEGSHGPFNMYDHSSPTYTPTDPISFFTNPKNNSEGINNAYDNTIVYTDACIRKISEGLKGRPLLYVYVSDHGEFLGHDNIWGRPWIYAHSTPEEGIRAYRNTTAALTGMFILPSDEWLSLHPHFMAAAEQLRKNSSYTICHGHIFDTLLGIFGIETPHYHAEWDCSSPMVKPYTGTQPAAAE